MSPGKQKYTQSQVADKATETPNKTEYKYVMPGLCPKIAQGFRHKKGVIPQPRTLAMNLKVESGAVLPALIHTLFEMCESNAARLRALEGRLPSPAAREFRVFNGGRAA